MNQNITLSAEKSLIRKAREKALRERKSLNVAFRQWLHSYAGGSPVAKDYERLMEELSHADPGEIWSRD